MKVRDIILAVIWAVCLYCVLLIFMTRVCKEPLGATNMTFVLAYLVENIYKWLSKK